MGIAIIAKGADFSNKNIGTVTGVTIVELSSLSIAGPDTVVGSAQFEAVYSPSNTTQRGVTWSIKSGSQYASIDSNTGLVTALVGANSSSVTIKVTSNVKPSVTVEKTIAVTALRAPMDFTELKTYNQTSWRKEENNQNPIDGYIYYYIHADDATKVGANISTVRNVTGTDYGAYQVFKIPIPDGATSVELFPIKTSQYSGYAFADNSDVVTGFIYNPTVNSGTAATYSIPAGSKFIYMPLSPTVYTNTNNGANLTVTFS